MKPAVSADFGSYAEQRTENVPSTFSPRTFGHSVSGKALGLWRRLDWRFLLPDPNLQSIGYIGPSCELLSALQMFSESVVVFSGERLHPVYPEFDVAVFRHPSLEMLKAAGRMVKPGGNFYLELAGPLREATGARVFNRSIITVMGYARALWDIGCDEIQAYWHRPSFDDCREIVPLFDRLAMQLVLSRQGPIPLAREIKLLASRCLLETGLLRHIIPSYSIVAHKRDRC